MAIASAIVVVLALVPVCALFGALTYASVEAQSGKDIDTHHRIEAIVVDVPAFQAVTAEYGSVAGYYTTVEWKSGTGGQREGQVKVPAHTDQGQTVEIWVDDAGNPVDAPKTGLESAILGVATAIGVWVGCALLVAAAVAMTLEVGRRARMRQWDHDWRNFEARRG